MTEEETNFDPSLKKKKKKKKTPFDLDGALNEGGEDMEASKDDDAVADDIDLDSFGTKKKKKKKPVIVEDEDKDEDAKEEDDLDLESFGKKKKKGKKKPLGMEELEDALPNDDENEDLDLESFGKKKKKKKRGDGQEDSSKADDDNKENADSIDINAPKNVPLGEEESGLEEDEDATTWGGSDRDYTYDELLQRVYTIMKEKNPDTVVGETKKFVMRPPQVVKVGAKKTAFVNFAEIAKMLHRQPKHLLAFLFAELGTTGALDGSNQLVMKGKFQQKHIENVLRRYIKEYVTCHTCRSPDTILNKETRLFFLQCMKCNSRCSVQTIKTGFQAVTGKRSAIRNKQ